MLTEEAKLAMLDLPKDDFKEMKKENVIDRVRQLECSICMESLGHFPNQPDATTDSVFRTPCKHNFHKECLKN